VCLPERLIGGDPPVLCISAALSRPSTRRASISSAAAHRPVTALKKLAIFFGAAFCRLFFGDGVGAGLVAGHAEEKHVDAVLELI
jgi:hypothetical protein